MSGAVAFVCVDDVMPVWIRADSITAVYGDAEGRTHVAFARDEITVDKMADEVLELIDRALRGDSA